MTIKGSILRIIEKNYDGKLRTVVILKIGTYVNKNQNNELAIFFNETKLHLLNDFGVDDTVIIECTTLSFTNDNHRFYNYNRSTNVWSLAGGGVSVTSFSAGTTGLTPSTATTGAVTLGGTLAVANGGTGLTTFTAANRIPYSTSATALATSGNLTFDGTKLILSGNQSFTGTQAFVNNEINSTYTQTTATNAAGVGAFNETVSAATNVPTLIFPEPNKLFEFTVLILVPDTKVFCFVLNLEVRFNKLVSVNSIKTLRSAETVPVVVIGLGETRIPVPPEIEVNEPDPPPLPAPPPRGKITV